MCNDYFVYKIKTLYVEIIVHTHKYLFILLKCCKHHKTQTTSNESQKHQHHSPVFISYHRTFLQLEHRAECTIKTTTRVTENTYITVPSSSHAVEHVYSQNAGLSVWQKPLPQNLYFISLSPPWSIAHSQVPMWDGPQTPQHALQSCPLNKEAWTQHWPQGAVLVENLWSSKEDLVQTINFIHTIKLDVWGQSWNGEDILTSNFRVCLPQEITTEWCDQNVHTTVLF